MATVTWNVNKDSRIGVSGSYEAGAGKGDFVAFGYYSGYVFRALLGFSYSFSGMVSITSAVLHVTTGGTGGNVESGANAACYVYRITGSWSEGSSASLSSSNGGGVTWANQPSVTSTNRVAWNITNSNNTTDTVDITGIVRDAFAANSFLGVELRSQDEGDASYTHEIKTRENGSTVDAYIVVTYETNNPPRTPDNYDGLGTNSMNPRADAVVHSLLPTFTGTFGDPDAGNTMSAYQIVVTDDAGNQVHDTGAVSSSVLSYTYSGPALAGNTFYKWKAKYADQSGAWGAYSGLQRFKVNTAPNQPTISLTQSPTTDVKTLTPTFNVTHNDNDPSDTLMYGYQIILETAAGAAVWDSGQVDTSGSPAATKSITYGGSPALSWQASYRWRAATKDSNGKWGAFNSTNATFTTHTTGVPTGLAPTGDAIGTSLTAQVFSGSRASTSDLLTHVNIFVYDYGNPSPKWNSGWVTTGVSQSGFSTTYGGAALTAGARYEWQAQVRSSVGGDSGLSAKQSFYAPDTNTPNITTPTGSGITPVTNLQFTFTRGTNFNIHQLYLYSNSAGTTQVTSDLPVAYTATGSKTFTYTGTLAWNTTYYWKVRVSADGGTNWSPWAGLISFTTDAAGVPTLNAPTTDSWLSEVIDHYDNTTSVTNGTSAATSIDTAEVDKKTGRGSLKIALTSLAAASTSETYRTVTKNLSRYGGKTPFKIWVRASTLTNLSVVRVRFTFATVSDYAEYTITPGSTAWEQKTVTKDTPAATGGTVNWSNITRIGIRVTAGASAYTGNINVDDLQADASVPSFDGTTFNSETISTYRIRIYTDPAGATTPVWDSGDLAGSGTTFSKLYTGSTLTKGTTYYWQASYVKSSGAPGNYSSLIPFIINTAPTAPSSMVPAAGAVVVSDLTPTFEALFSDAEKTSRGDAPGIYEVYVYRNSDSALVYSLVKDSGLSGGTNSVTDGDAGVLKLTGAANPIAYETEYKYRSRFYDSMGAAGEWSSYLVFKPSQPPVATISSPAHLGTVSSPTFTISWSHTSGGSKAQNSYQLRVERSSDGYLIYDTDRVYSSATSFVFPSGLLVNSTNYDIKVRVWDTDSLDSAYDTNTITTSWTAPDPIVDFITTGDPSNSAIVMTWVESTVTPTSFRKYRLYRREGESQPWEVLTDINNRATTTYSDYLAANTIAYDYKITQWSIVPGDADLESGDSDLATEALDTDSWYVVGADRAPDHIFELPVIGAPFAEPVQQEVFEPLGTSRKVIIRGKELGAEGSLQCRWKDAEVPTAKQQVNYIKSNAGPHVLKSPFGDIWFVEFSGPTKDYIGGGHMNATLVWTEVE